DLKALLAKASPLRSGDQLAGVAAESEEQRIAARYALADLPVTSFLDHPVIPYESDEVTRLIVDGHDAAALPPLAHVRVDGVLGINPATDSPERCRSLLEMLDDIRTKLEIPTQGCVLAHVTTTLDLIEKGAPVDLVFQSIAGTQAANRSFGIDLALLRSAREAA